MTLSLLSFTRFGVRAISLLVLLLGASLLAQAQSNATPAIRYVKPAGTGNGSSWANASGNLQAMINASVATDQVWVAGGTYKPTGTPAAPGTDRNVSFAMKIGVLIYGGFAGSETSLSQRPIINTTTPSSSILSGDIGTAGSTADNSYHVISNPMDLINTAVLDGFIITGGNANGSNSAGSGGGMFNPGNDSGLGASPTVRNCSFQGNSAGIGGAMTNYGSATSNPVLVNCLFRGNSAIQGGAIYNYKNSRAVGNPVLTNCSFQNNSASTSGGAIFNLGNFSNCAPVLTNCSFQSNSAPQGGAFYNDGNQFYSRPKLNNCVLFGNGGSNSIRNSSDSYAEAIYSLFEAGAAFTNGFFGSNVSGVTVNPFASTSSVALNACAPAINSGYDFSYNTSNGPPTDLAGNDRFYAGGQIDMGAVEFQAAPSSITITPPSVSTTTVGSAFSQAFSASGGSGPYILASGSLPPGITLATSGVLSGTPTQYGYYTFTVKIIDPVTGCTGISAGYTLLVRSDRPIRYVKAGGTGNGDSWANASGDLQSQIDVVGAEQVWVAAGTYKPTTGTDRTISFAMRTGVAIYGGFVGNETALSARPAINPVRGALSRTILSGDIGVVGDNADNTYHVILNRNGMQATAILDGFVITGGNANRDGYSYEGGGGMANISRRPAGAINPTVRNCSFQGNTATHGGAIFNDASPGLETTNAYPQTSSPTLINCVFRDNSARAGGAVSNNAALDGFSSSPQFDNCQFINNTASDGGAIENFSTRGGEVSFKLTNCLFQGNTADATGGAIANNLTRGGYSYPVLTNCSFQGNSIKNMSGFSRLGGALHFTTSGATSSATLTNCSFQGNMADQGGAVYAFSQAVQDFPRSSCRVTLISSVVFGNGGNKTFAQGGVSPTVSDVIALGNSLIESSATNYYSYGGLNNIPTSTSPFASPDSPALAANSPAVNAGTSDVQGTDVAGNPRIVGCRIDMGAYEFQYDPAVAITAQPAASSVVCGRAAVSVPVGVSGQYLTYQWYKDSFANPVTGQTSATLTLTNIQPANAGSYSLVVTGSCNSLTSTAFTLTVNQPTVSISPGSATICQGKSVLLTASGASTYAWSNSTTGNTLSATTAGAYSVTGVDGNGCSNFATAIVTENKPTVSISPVSATICPGKSVLLTASGASTYTWSNNTTDNTLSATTAGTYSVTGVDGNGCANTATATITENKPTVSISPNPASICQVSSVLLTASGASTGETLSYTWSNNTTSNTLSATTVGTYSVTGVAANGCFNSATATVTDTRPIVSITATPSATVTQGASITLTASGTGATSFAWSSGSTGNSTVINPATSAPYSVTVRNAAGCVTVASLDITVTPVVCGPVIYVTQTGSGQRDGSSWANALGSSQLQFGINTAADCGENGQVWVAAGTYKPTTGNDRSASFALRNGVSVYGGFVGNETALTDRPAYNPVANRPSSTTLSGDIGTVGNTSDNSFRVISNPASLSLTATAVLDGFVIMGGAGGTLGGGMFNDGSSPTLRNCSFVGNSVSASGSTISRGGAIYNGNSSSPQLYNCYFLNNSASSLAGVNGLGGAMANLNSSNPQLTNCNFVNNRVSGSAQNQGGAVANNLNSSPQLINCSFLSNSASGGTVNRGGAVANANGSNAQLINCSFLNNSVSGATSSTGNQGGAVYNNVCTPQLTNCVLFGNGGANTFYNATGGSVVVAYSLLETTVASFTAGANNLTTDVSPFVSATDTRLNGCSPAINAGDNGANTTTTDLDGNPRIYAGTLARIDMGAYEYQGVAGVVTTVPTVNTATVGLAFSQNVTASGGSGPYSYSLASGILPPGLSLSTTGVLSGNPTQTGSFTITVSATNASSCLGVSAPYVLTVTDAASPNPTLAGFTASPGAVCAGSVTTFTATVGNVTGSYGYTLTNGSNLLTGTAATSVFSQSVTASGTGPQNFTLTVSANGESVTSVTSLTVNPLPVASLTNNGPLTCAQSSVTLTAGGAADASGSSYTFANGSGVVIGTPGPINTVVVSTSDTYSVTVASASGCLSTTSTVVTTNQNVPTVRITPGSATLSCASPSVSLTAVGTGSVRWSTGETTPVISATTATTYSVTLTSANGCSAVASASVSQDNTAPVASLVSSGTLSCGITSVTLTANPNGQSYQFSAGATQLGTSNQAVVSASGPYSVTVLSGNGCSAVASTSVNQDNTVPTASLINNGPLSCKTTSVTLTASGGTSYRFSNGASQIGNGNTATVSSAGVYSVTVISGNGCSAVTSTSVSQDNTAPVVSLVSSGTLSCAVTSVTLTASPDGLNYLFSAGATQISTSNQAAVSMAGLYSVTVIAGNSCSATASTTVQSNTAAVSNAVPTVSTATVGIAFSQSFTAAGGAGPYSYSVANGSLPPGLMLATTGVLSGTPTQAGSFTLTVLGQDATGCLGVSAPYVLTVNVAPSTTRYVRAGGSGSGNSWADASGDLQSQINFIGAQQVWVATGTYKPGGNANTDRNISFSMKNGVAIYGGFPATGNPGSLTVRNPDSFTTVLSGNNSYHVVYNSEGLNASAVLDGVVITGGSAITAERDVSSAASAGGGMYNEGSSPTLINCRFMNNYAFAYGGGMYNKNSNPTLINCRFMNNSSDQGGGMFNAGSPSLVNCSFINNSSNFGGGMYNEGGFSSLINCSFIGNRVDDAGSVIYNRYSRTTLTNCIVFGNIGPKTFDSSYDNNSSVTVAYSLLETGVREYIDGGNNLTTAVSPFVSATDTRLNACAPAIDAGSNAANSSTTDLAGNPRRFNGSSIDMGAYEYQGQPNLPTAITQQPPSGSLVCQGNTVSIPFSVSGTGTLTYQLVNATGMPVGPSQSATPLTLANVQPAQSGSYSVIVTGSCPGSVTSTAFSLTVTNPQPPTLVTQTGGPYPAGVSSLTISQNVGDVILTTSGCAGGTITWNGGMATTLAVSTVSTGTQTFSATCQQNGCTSPTATATVTVVGRSLRVLHREATNNDLFTTAIKPYLILENTGNQPIPYQQITVRYWLTVENPAPLTNLPVYYADLGTSLVHPAFVPISPTRTGATGYVEYRFDAAAGSLAPRTNSGRIENGISKADYSPFNQADDYSYVLNRDYTPNQRITAYVDGQIVWGQEPAAPGTTPPSPLQVAASATSPVIPTTANTTLIANAQGGSGSYTYAFSGPGTLTPNGNTAVAANLPAGVQTFTLTVTDTSVPTAQMATATVSVTVTGPPNSAPTPGVNASQTATVGTMFAYTVAAFTDAETPGGLTYTARLSPANGLTFNPATRVITGTPTLTGETSVTITATDPGGLSASTVFTITAIPAPNSAPTPGVNASQTATVGTRFAYTANAFGDAQTPTSLTYTATITPGNNLIFDPATRVVSGTPSLSGVVSVTITATDPGGLSTSTVFTITVNPAPVVAGPATLRVLHRDASNGQLITNAIYPYLILENTGSTAIPYQQLTVRYWLTVETPAPLTNLVVYSAQIGAGNVHPLYVPLVNARSGATGYVEYSFGAGAGSLAGGTNSGDINTAISKQDYSGFDQADDYSYALNRDFTPNTHITAYVNGALVWGTEPAVGARLAAEQTDATLRVRILGNPAPNNQPEVVVSGIEGLRLRYELTDAGGRPVGQWLTERPGAVDQQMLDLSHQPAGLYLLRVSTATQSRTVKLVRP